MTKKIRIIKAHNEKAWYADKIGKIYVVSNGEYPLDVGGVMVYRKGTDDSYGVRKGDFEVIIENETEADVEMGKGIIKQIQAEIETLKAKVERLEKAEDFREQMRTAIKSAKPVGLKSPQQQRDEIVDRAKRDVAEILNEYQLSDKEVTFTKDTRTINVSIEHLFSGKVLARGIAKCAPNDCFNVHIGKAIALRRALGLEVPAEYLNAPQPTEVRVGDVVETYLGIGEHHATFEVTGYWEGDRNKLTGKGLGYTSFEPEVGDKVIDDSREKVSE